MVGPGDRRNNKKNESYMATQKMLVEEEKRQLEYWDRYLPKEIRSEHKTTQKEAKTHHEKQEEVRLDKADKLESYLNTQKLEFDEMYGTKTVESNRCLFCGTRHISIVRAADQIYMNCGHAVSCEVCLKKKPSSCTICGVEISYFIKANKEENKVPYLRKNSSKEVGPAHQSFDEPAKQQEASPKGSADAMQKSGAEELSALSPELASPTRNNFGSLKSAQPPVRMQEKARVKTIANFARAASKNLPFQVPEEDDSQQNLQQSRNRSEESLQSEKQLSRHTASDFIDNKELDQSEFRQQAGWLQEVEMQMDSKSSEGLGRIENRSPESESDDSEQSSIPEISVRPEQGPAKPRKPPLLPLDSSLDG